MDAQTQLALNAEICFAVLGNAATREHILIPLGPDGYPLTDAEVQEAHSKNFVYAGVMGLHCGVADARCEPGPDTLRIMCAAAPTFLRYLRTKLSADNGGDWLERIYQLPDTRTEN